MKQGFWNTIASVCLALNQFLLRITSIVANNQTIAVWLLKWTRGAVRTQTVCHDNKAVNCLFTVSCMISYLHLFAFHSVVPLLATRGRCKHRSAAALKPAEFTGGKQFRKHGCLHEESSSWHRNAKADWRCDSVGGDRLRIPAAFSGRAGRTFLRRFSETLPDPAQGDPTGALRTWWVRITAWVGPHRNQLTWFGSACTLYET